MHRWRATPLHYPHCDQPEASDLRMHRKEKHANPEAHNAYTCSVCGAQFSTFARVTTHKLTHGINTESLIVPDEVMMSKENDEDVDLNTAISPLDMMSTTFDEVEIEDINDE
ncbi:hypothetical protein J6590_103219 [Homalodisca vitripennis]|nr:hypothetical protein J6590_103219 [Homalodisca vitripennis]